MDQLTAANSRYPTCPGCSKAKWISQKELWLKTDFVPLGTNFVCFIVFLSRECVCLSLFFFYIVFQKFELPCYLGRAGQTRTCTVYKSAELACRGIPGNSRDFRGAFSTWLLAVRKTLLVPGTILVIWQVRLKWSTAEPGIFKITVWKGRQK